MQPGYEPAVTRGQIVHARCCPKVRSDGVAPDVLPFDHPWLPRTS
jgi:hypothetical protein